MRAGFSEGGRAAAMVDGDVDAAAGAQRILHDVLGDVGGEASDSPYLAA